MSDSTISSVANGGSPQPVAIQEATPTSQEAIEAIENEIVPGEESNVSAEEAAIDAATESGDLTQKQAKELKKKLLLKVDGKDIEEEISWDDEEGLKKHLQKSKAFDKRLSEFSSYKNQVEKFIEQLKNDPEAFLEKLGHNVDDMAEKRLARKIEEMKKSPEQIEKEKMQKEIEELRKKMKADEEEKSRIEMEKMRNEQAAMIESEITEALGSTNSRLPKQNPFVVQKIAQNMLIAMKNGYPNVTVKDVIPIVEKQWKEELRSYFDTSNEDLMEELVGKQNLDRYRKGRMSAAKKSASQTTTARQVAKDTGTSKPQEQQKQPKSFKKLFSYHDD